MKTRLFQNLLCPFLPAVVLAQSGTIPVPAPVPFPASFTGENVTQSVLAENIILDVTYDEGGRDFTVRWRERPTSTSYQFPWRDTKFKVSLTFRITDVTVRQGGNEIYVGGMRDDGKGVIKRFNFQPRPGGWEVRSVPATAQPIGTPMVNHSCEQALNGTWSEPPQAAYGVATRSQLLGDTVGVPRSIAVDPFGRYLLILTEATSEIYLLDLLADPHTLQLLVGPSTIGELAQVDEFLCLTVASGGHAFQVFDRDALGDETATDPVIAMIDGDNDGSFEIIALIGEGEDAVDAAGLGHQDTSVIWQTSGVGEW